MRLYPSSSNDINGFFHKMRIRYNTSASTTSFGSSDDPFIPQNLFWQSQGETVNQWLTVKLTDYCIYLSNYSVQTYSNEYEGQHPKSWKIEGSLQGGQKQELDQVGQSTTSRGLSIQTRPSKKRGPFDTFTITQTGINWLDQNYFTVHKLDFFGVIIPKSRYFTKNLKLIHNQITILLYFIAVCLC